MVSNKWGFTNLTRLDYQKGKEDGTVVNDGVGIKILRKKGPLARSALFQALEKA